MSEDTRYGILPSGIRRIVSEIKKCSLKEEAMILDCGCGPGNVIMFLADSLKSRHVYGLDINADELKNSAIKDVLQADLDKGRRLPFKDQSFDLVFSNHVIEHLLDPDHFLEEIHRILKEDGVFVLTTPNLAAWYNRIILLFGYQPHFTEVSIRNNVGKLYFGKLSVNKESAIGGHVRIFTYPALKELLSLYRFYIKASFSYGHPYLLSSKIIGILEKLSQFSKKLSSTICFICKKAH